MKNTITQIIFHDEKDATRINDLVDFLKHLKSAYAYMLTNDEYKQYRDYKAIDFNTYLPETVAPVKWIDYLNQSNINETSLSKSYQKQLGEHELQILRISKSSPLNIELSAIEGVLALALIFSGGRILLNKNGASFEFKSLGDALGKIEDYKQKRRRNRIDNEREEKYSETIDLKERLEQKKLEKQSIQNEIEMLVKIKSQPGQSEENKRDLQRVIDGLIRKLMV